VSDGRAGKRAGVGVLEARAEEWHAGDDQPGAKHSDDRHGTVPDPDGHSPERARRHAQLGRVEPATDECQHGGQQAVAGEHGDEHDADAADGRDRSPLESNRSRADRAVTTVRPE
jgi:hypothetical protein